MFWLPLKIYFNFRRSRSVLWRSGALLWVGLLGSGCEPGGPPPATQSFSVQGTLTLQEEGGNVAEAVVHLYAAPDDPLLVTILSDYPSVGFAPVIPSLFDPLNQTPLSSLSPAADGSFHFDDLREGQYVLDAVLADHACAEPLVFSLPGTSNVGTLILTTPQLVSGNLSQTTWTSGSVVRLSGNLLILPAATLTIEPGVLVEVAGDYTLTVTGALTALGQPQHPIRFRLTPEHWATGGDWGGLRMDQALNLCRLTGITVQHAATALRAIGGNVQVEECLIEAPGAYGIYFSAEAQGWVRQSLIRDGDQGLVADNSSPEFEQNVILRTSNKALSVKTNSHATVQGNAIVQCDIGIWSDWNTTPTIEYNLISGGSYGLQAQDGFYATVQYNEFEAQTQKCISLQVRNCYPLVTFNNFLNAPATIFYVNGNNGQQADTVFAPNNYWDGEDAVDIPQRIMDGFDLGSWNNPIGPVDYQPFRLTPVSGAGP